jgi:hypothetical protein
MEMKEMIASTNVSCGLFSPNHSSKYLSMRAWLPEGKQEAVG